MAKDPARGGHFVCPSWRAGQRCRPYFISNWTHWVTRLIFTILGVGIALSLPLKSLLVAAPPPAAIEVSVLTWGAALVLAAVGSIFLTMHNEVDAWGCLVAGIGTPSLLVILMHSVR